MSAPDELPRPSHVVAVVDPMRRFDPQDRSTNPTRVLALLQDPASIDAIDHEGTLNGILATSEGIRARKTLEVAGLQ